MSIDYNIIQKQLAIPKASSMIESFRAIGYSLETAIADIIDNSISAGAKNINIQRIWKGSKSVISIEDDGCGMNNEELILALSPGAQNPLEERRETDLGRFGLGLKTASFSQCRKLSVISRKNDYAPVYWSWDLDYVAQSDKWELIKWIPDEFEHSLDKKNGTIVIWTDLDRVVSSNTSETNESAKLKFSESLDRVKHHIAMTFHRFIEDKSIKIFWCGHEIEAWNPFCIDEQKTQQKSLDYLSGGATMRGFVLPHKNNFSSELAYKKAEGINGWNAQQGFYVYRGKRLLLAGDWLGIRRKEEHYKLVRIQIDLPNTLDTEWQIDIKKSRAYPPAYCKEQLASYARTVCADGCEVYRHRGRIIKQRAGQKFQPLWLEKKKDNNWSFVLNREHSIIERMKEYAKEEPYRAIDILLKFIEESIPTKSIYINEAQNEEKQKESFSDINTNIIKETIMMIYQKYREEGMDDEQAKSSLKIIEPFNNFEDIIDEL
jgi:hypothetical protein